MRKSFTWFLSLMVFVMAFATQGYAQEEQETVELYAEENASDCYNEANDYTVTISVRDFIQLTSFDLDLEFNPAIFTYDGMSGVNVDLASGISDSESGGVINLAWSGSATTIGDNVKTDVLVLHFTLNGYPGNVVESFSSDMDWISADFWYTTPDGDDLVKTINTADGDLAVDVSLTGIETELTTETCFGTDATVTVTAPEAAMYLFNEDPIPANWIWTAQPDFLAAAGETVTIRVKDASGCMSLVSSVVIPETIQPVAFAVETHDPSCFGGQGSVVINATGGSAPYSYWIADDVAGAPDLTSIVEKGNFQFSMAPGTYWVNVQDANDCASLPWEVITITDANPELYVSALSTDILCFGESTGTIATTVKEGDLTMVSLDGNVWETLPYLFEDLAAGTYKVYAKNDNGCMVDSSGVVVAQPTEGITFDIVIDDTSCGDGTDDGAITVTNVAGGSGMYDFSLDGITYQPGNVFSGLAPIYYSLWVRDANGCVVEYDNPNLTGNQIAVQSPEDIKITVNITDPLCNDEDAALAVSVTGGTGAYEYSFDGSTWVDTMTIDAWAAPYVANVWVRNNDTTCAVEYVGDLTVTNPDLLVATVLDTLAPTCLEGNDGNVTLQIEGGTTPYSYSVNGSAWRETSDEFTNIKVPVGTHSILVKDAGLCELAEIVQTITLESNLITATSDVHIECFNDKVGTIRVEMADWAEGVGTRSYTYYVENAAGVISAFVPSNIAGTTTLFNAGTYNIWVVDNYTCESNADTAVVTENAELRITEVMTNGASCFGSFEGTVTVHAMGGNVSSVLEYALVNNEGALDNIDPSKWLDFDTYDVLTTLSTVSFQADKGTYWLAVMDDCGAPALTYGPIDVAGYEELLVDEADITTDESDCYLDSMATITVPMSAVTGGAGSYLFTLLVQDGMTWEEVEGKVDQVTGVFDMLPAGTYQVLVEDAEDCPSYTTGDIDIDDPDELEFDDLAIKHMSCFDSNDGRITIWVEGGTPGYSYAINNMDSWIAFGKDIDDDWITEKTYIVTETGTFKIWIKDALGCVTGPEEVTIEAPEQLGAEIEVLQNVSCPGGADGQIAVVGTGGWDGMTVFQYKVNETGTWGDSTFISGLALPAGDHVLYVSDAAMYMGDYQSANNCNQMVDFTITEPGKITYDVVISDVKCKDGADGTLTVTVLSGGTPIVNIDPALSGYMVGLTGDDFIEGYVITGADLSYTFDSLTHSHYTVYVQDANGCTILPSTGNDVSPWTTQESWEVAQPDVELTLDPEWLSDVTCYDGEDGKIKFVATGGTAPYKYYAGLSIADDGHVLIPEAPAEGSDEWLDNDTVMVGAGTWVTWVLDANGCMVGGEYDEGIAVNKWRVKVEQPDSIVWAFPMMEIAPDVWVPIYSEPSCNGVWDGVVNILTITGGSMTYNAHVTGVSAAGEVVDTMYTDIEADVNSPYYYKLAGLPASSVDSFAVTVTDDNGCTSATDMIFVDQPDVLTVNLEKAAGAFTCADAVEGLIEAYVEGGTVDYAYQLLKNGVVHTPWQTDGSAFLVEVGNTFIVQVMDDNGCTAEDTIVIDSIAPVVITSIDNISCFADEKASATVNATAEAGRMLYVKYRIYEETNDYTEIAEGFTTSIDVTGLEFDAENIDDKHYEFIVTDDMGCESTPDTLTFDYVQTELVYTAELGVATECTQDVTISVGGGTAPYVVMVNDSVLVDMTYTMERGSYLVKVMDSHLCSKEETIEVVGDYVVRDTTINTYIDETTMFVDAEAGVDTMLAVGTHQWVYTLVCERTLNVTVVEIPRPYAIVEIQGEGDASPIVDKIAQVTATVTAISAGEGFFVQDANAANSALWIEYNAVNDLGLTIGDVVVVVGTVKEIANVTSIEATDVTATIGTLVITAMELAPTAAQAEMYESMVVAVMGGRATAADAGTGEWTVYYEVTDDITVNDWLYASTPVEGHYFNVTGIVNARLDNFRLEPRMESDVVDITETTDIDTPKDAIEFSVYPNPFNDIINVVNHDKLTRVVISNIAGQRVVDVAYPNSEIRTGNLVSGIYVVSMFTENGIAKTEKIIKK